MIPKTIHYIWLGNHKKNKLIQRCIKSWYRLHPRWEIKLWSDGDFSFDECEFVKIAHKNANWAYLSDYYRLKILYEHGGIYLDTDMLLIKSLDFFTSHETFWGYETENVISCGIIGAEKENPFIRLLINHYHQYDTTNWNKHTIPEIVTQTHQANPNIALKIYPIDYFYPYPAHCRLNEININYKKHITPNTYGIHLWEFSWSYFSRYQLFLRNKKPVKALISFAKEAVTKKNTFKAAELMKTIRILLRK